MRSQWLNQGYKQAKTGTNENQGTSRQKCFLQCDTVVWTKDVIVVFVCLLACLRTVLNRSYSQVWYCSVAKSSFVEFSTWCWSVCKCGSPECWSVGLQRPGEKALSAAHARPQDKKSVGAQTDFISHSNAFNLHCSKSVGVTVTAWRTDLITGIKQHWLLIFQLLSFKSRFHLPKTSIKWQMGYIWGSLNESDTRHC